MANQFQVLALNEAFKVFIIEKPFSCSPDDTKKVDAFWKRYQRIYPGRLFNGELFCTHSYDAQKLTGSFIEYKYFYAQSRLPNHSFDWKICPAAVTGITWSQDMVLVAKRADWVTTDPLRWELAPAGTLSGDYRLPDQQLDYKGQLIGELHEETGITLSEVLSIKPNTIFHDTVEPVLDICLDIYLDPEICQRPLSLSDEYTEYLWLKRVEIPDFVKEKEMSTLATAMLNSQCP